MSKKVVLAYSGGLDTSWCIPFLKGRGYDVTTCTVDAGGFSDSDVEDLKVRSLQLGADNHVHIPAKVKLFDEVIRHLIAGNVTRGGTYPLCVGAERSLQATEVARLAHQLGVDAIAHGCTAAGNDQIRFETALRCVAPDIQVLAPVRDETPTRAEQVEYLTQRGLPIPEHGLAYSVNCGLWGVTIGGSETTGTEFSIPESQWMKTFGAFNQPSASKSITIRFIQGIPVGIDGELSSPIKVIEQLDEIAGPMGIGRGIHLGDTILGIKGRVAYEAPAATILLAAHRELEKLVLTKRQQQLKDSIAQSYGDMVHEGLFLEPACRDIEALFDSTQLRVSGTVKVLLRTGSLFIEGVTSDFSLHAASRAVYGEAVGEWTAEDAKGFSRIYGLSAVLSSRVGSPS